MQRKSNLQPRQTQNRHVKTAAVPRDPSNWTGSLDSAQPFQLPPVSDPTRLLNSANLGAYHFRCTVPQLLARTQPWKRWVKRTDEYPHHVDFLLCCHSFSETVTSRSAAVLPKYPPSRFSSPLPNLLTLSQSHTVISLSRALEVSTPPFWVYLITPPTLGFNDHTPPGSFPPSSHAPGPEASPHEGLNGFSRPGLIHSDPLTPASRGWLVCPLRSPSSDPAFSSRRSRPSPLLGHSPQCVSYFGDAIQVPPAGHAASTGTTDRHRRHLFPRAVHAEIPWS